MTARSRLLAIAVLVLLPLVWLWPSVFGGRTLVPFDPAQFPPAANLLDDAGLAAARADSNYEVTEVWPWLLPQMDLAREELSRGNLPGWDPHARTGAPLHEVGVLGVFYPPHWLWMFGPWRPQDVLVWLTWISLALAGLLAFGLLREVQLSPAAALFGAAVYQLSGPMSTNGYFWTRLPGLAWLPALLWAVLRLGDGSRLRARALLGFTAAFALPWFAGFPPYATAGALLAVLLTTRVVLERLGREGSAAALVLLRRYLVAFAVAALATMPQVLPSLWFYAAEGARSAAPSAQQAMGAMFERYGLLGYLTPDAFGHPLLRRELGPNPLCFLWGGITDAAGKAAAPNFNYTEYTVFVGAATIVLAGYGAVRGRGHLRWFLVLTLGLLLALALQLPLVRLVYHLPVVGNVAPMRWVAPATLLVVWLAAIGFDRLQLVEPQSRVRVALAWAWGAVLLRWLSGWPAAWHAADPEWPANAIGARFGLPTAEVVKALGGPAGGDRFARACEQLAAAGRTASWWFAAVAVLALLHAWLGHRRPQLRLPLAAAIGLSAIVQLALHGAPLLAGHALRHGTDTPVHEALRTRAAAAMDQGGFMIARAGTGAPLPTQLPPGQLVDRGIRDLQFYTHYDARSIEPLRAVLGAEWSGLHANSGYVKAALPDAVLEHPLFDLYGVRYVLATEPLQHAGTRVEPELAGRGGFFVYERPHPLPRAFTVPAVRELPDDAAVLAAMADPNTRFDAVAFATAGAAEARAVPGSPARSVRFVRDDPRAIELEVGAGTAPWLVLTDTWFPGWSATIDGEPAAVSRCNHCQRLIALPRHACTVRLAHRCPLLLWGFGLFAAGAALAGLALRRARRPASRAAPATDETGA